MSRLAHREATTYYTQLERGLRLTGAGWRYYAERRVEWTLRRLVATGLHPRRILDYGCGPGDTLPLLAQAFNTTEVFGCDISEEMVKEARRRHPHFCFLNIDEIQAAGSFDLIYMNGVLHHVPSKDRLPLMRQLRSLIAPGGWLALWENNPWNPGTRLLMRRVPFDRDAEALSILQACRLLREAGYRKHTVDFLFFFPPWLGPLTKLDPFFCKIPLGGQYLVLARRE